MPLNRHALIRYRAIDACLRRRSRRWTLPDLIVACSNALAEAIGSNEEISKRTIQRDIENLRKDWEAPIEVEEQKYYYYTDPNFSLEKIPLTDEDAFVLLEIREIMQSFQEFDQVRELDRLIQKVEKSIKTSLPRPSGHIQIDHMSIVAGRKHLPVIYRAIIEIFTLEVQYQSFHQANKDCFAFSPYLLKAYNSRWYVLGHHHSHGSESILALDRIQNISQSHVEYHTPVSLNIFNYFSNRIGVSGSSTTQSEDIVIWINPSQTPYVKSRPWHSSQKILSVGETGMIISLKIIPNYEFISRVLSFGDGVKVLSPSSITEIVIEKLQTATGLYKS